MNRFLLEQAQELISGCFAAKALSQLLATWIAPRWKMRFWKARQSLAGHHGAR
jgi:hypothetical protein